MDNTLNDSVTSLPEEFINKVKDDLTTVNINLENLTRQRTNTIEEIPEANVEFLNKLRDDKAYRVLLDRSGPVTRLKTISRRGNTYNIQSPREPEPSVYLADADDDEFIKMASDLHLDVLAASEAANKKANVFSGFSLFCTFMVIVGGLVVGFLGFFNYQAIVITNSTDTTAKEAITITIGSIGLLIATLQGLETGFSLHKRSVTLKQAHNRLRKLARQIKDLERSDLKLDDKFKRLDQFYDKLDELEMVMFDNSITDSYRQASNSNTSEKYPRRNKHDEAEK